jgi:hypothetical protein
MKEGFELRGLMINSGGKGAYEVDPMLQWSLNSSPAAHCHHSSPICASKGMAQYSS